jgi:hypothetical protein
MDENTDDERAAADEIEVLEALDELRLVDEKMAELVLDTVE